MNEASVDSSQEGSTAAISQYVDEQGFVVDEYGNYPQEDPYESSGYDQQAYDEYPGYEDLFYVDDAVRRYDDGYTEDASGYYEQEEGDQQGWLDDMEY